MAPKPPKQDRGLTVTAYRQAEFMKLGYTGEIALLLAEHFEISLEDARRLDKLGATPAQGLRILW